MKIQIATFILAASQAVAGAGTPPIPKPESIQFVGIQKSTSADVGRDLGFSGKIGDTILNTYGDTARCGLGPSWPSGCGYPGASNSMARNSPDNPLSVTDYAHFIQDGWVQQFCDTYPDEPRGNGQFAVGITNILPVSETEGMLFWLLNNRTTPSLSNFPGSGVAKIELKDGYPTCTRFKNNNATGRDAEVWWGPTEPAFGDHAAFLGTDGYLYGMGGMSNAATGAIKTLSNHGLYMTRVKQAQYADWSAYEYWHGPSIGWTHDRLYNPPAEACVLSNVGQGSMFYSPHFGGYLYMYSFAGGLVVRLAYSPTGPWSNEFNTVYDMGCVSFGCSYSPSMMPWWDESGKTLYVQYSHAGDYDLHMLKITWPGEGRQSANAFPYSAGFKAISLTNTAGSTNSSKFANDEILNSVAGASQAQATATAVPVPSSEPATSAISPPRSHGHGHRHGSGKINYASPPAQYGKTPDVFRTGCNGCSSTVTVTVTHFPTPTPASY